MTEGKTTEMTQGDLLPDLVLTCTDKDPVTGATVVVDLTTATQVRVVGNEVGVGGQLSALFAQNLTGNSLGVVTRPWVAGNTDAAGDIQVVVQVTWPGGKVQTFPRHGSIVVSIGPKLVG